MIRLFLVLLISVVAAQAQTLSGPFSITGVVMGHSALTEGVLSGNLSIMVVVDLMATMVSR